MPGIARDVARLDALDRRILYQLDLDCRQSVPQIAKKVKAKKDTVAFRLRRIVNSKIITKFITEVDIARVGRVGVKGYFQFQNYNEEMEHEFFEYAGSFRPISWIVSGAGRWDAIIAYWGKSPFEFHQEYLKIMNKYSKYIVSKEFTMSMSWYWYNRKWLLGDEAVPVATHHGGEPQPVKLDALDHAVLQELIADARTPVVEIARKTKASPQSVINRIRRLKKEGVIKRFSIDLDYKKLGMIFCKTFVYLQNINEKKLKEIDDYCLHQPNIFSLVHTLGPWDLELELEVNDFEQVTKIMNELRNRFGDAIRNYEAIIISKQTTVRHMGE